MSAFTVRTFIAAPAERVFAGASDFAGAPGRISAVRGVELLTAGPVGRGTRFRETRQALGREVTADLEVAEFDPPRRYVLAGASYGFRLRSEFRFVPQAGGTEVETTVEVTPETAMARLLAGAVEPMLAAAGEECAKDLADLKAAIESAAFG